MSVRSSTAAPRCASGAMYCGVPATAGVIGRAWWWSSAATRPRAAMPKSRILTWPSRGHHQVLGLDVAVDHAVRVRGRQRPRRTASARPQNSSSDIGSAMRSRSVDAVDVLHDQQHLVVQIEHVVDGGDAGVVDLARAARLVEDRRCAARAIVAVGEQALEGDAAVEQRVVGEQHLAHAARPERPLDAEAPEEHRGSGPAESSGICRRKNAACRTDLRPSTSGTAVLRVDSDGRDHTVSPRGIEARRAPRPSPGRAERFGGWPHAATRARPIARRTAAGRDARDRSCPSDVAPESRRRVRVAAALGAGGLRGVPRGRADARALGRPRRSSTRSTSTHDVARARAVRGTVAGGQPRRDPRSRRAQRRAGGRGAARRADLDRGALGVLTCAPATSPSLTWVVPIIILFAAARPDAAARRRCGSRSLCALTMPRRPVAARPAAG